MKAIGFSKRQPSQSILRLILALVISGIVPVVGMSAGMSTRQNENPSAMRVTGIVTDTQCGSTHGSKTHGDAECTRLCVKLGAEYALAVGHKVYVLRGHQAELNGFAGDRVVVTGKVVNRNTIAVEWVAPYTVWAFFKK